MSPGRLALHSTGCGLPVSEFSNTSDGKCVVAGFLPPVASATAQSIASRAWSFCVDTVKSLNVGFLTCCFCQKHPSTLPSEVASAGIVRPLLLNSGRAPTSEGPKSDTITSIFGYLAMSAERTFCVSAGSQFVTSKGCAPMNLYLWVGSRILWRPWFSSTPWLLPWGPLSMSTLPPFGSTWRIQLPQFSPAWAKGVSTKTLKLTPALPPGVTRYGTVTTPALN